MRPPIYLKESPAMENHMEVIARPVLRVEAASRQAALHTAHRHIYVICLSLFVYQAAVLCGLME